MAATLEKQKKVSKKGDLAMSKGWSRKVEIKVDPGPEFRLESNLKDPGNGELVFNKTRDNMPKRDYYLLDFDLDDRSGLNLRFIPNPKHALWVNMGSTDCPQDECHSDEVYAVCVDQENGQKMVVRNEDETRAKFAFSIGFIKEGADPKDPNSYVRYDPVGDNQNGGI